MGSEMCIRDRFQSIRVVYKVGRHRPDRTQAAMIERRAAIAFDFQQHAIPHMQQYAATAVATAADALENGGGLLPAALQSRRWLLDVHASESKSALRRIAPPLQGRHDWCKFGLISIKEKARTECL